MEETKIWSKVYKKSAISFCFQFSFEDGISFHISSVYSSLQQ
jgi:hypothetical protein